MAEIIKPDTIVCDLLFPNLFIIVTAIMQFNCACLSMPNQQEF